MHETEWEVVRPEPRTAPCAVACRGDGDQVLALIGPNIQEGVAGFGDTLPAALRALADELDREVGVEPDQSAYALDTLLQVMWPACRDQRKFDDHETEQIQQIVRAT